MLQLEERPPYVQFELRAVENRAASIAAGHYVATDVAYALVTPAGSKDRIERIVSEWFSQLEQQVQEGRFPAAWFSAYKKSFEAWKEGQEDPANGTPIRNWPVLSPAQTKLLLDLGVRAVEDLAVANEETIGRLGMGGRALKQKAIEWLESAKNAGKQAEELVALQVSNKDLTERNEKLQAQIIELGKRLELLEQTPSGKREKL